MDACVTAILIAAYSALLKKEQVGPWHFNKYRIAFSNLIKSDVCDTTIVYGVLTANEEEDDNDDAIYNRLLKLFQRVIA